MAGNMNHSNGKSASDSASGSSDDGLDWELDSIGAGSLSEEVLVKLVARVDALETKNKRGKKAQKGLIFRFLP
jgi:hypothetical protein